MVTETRLQQPVAGCGLSRIFSRDGWLGHNIILEKVEEAFIQNSTWMLWYWGTENRLQNTIYWQIDDFRFFGQSALVCFP